MKKLMIAAAFALAFAGVSQASACYWGVANGTDTRPFYDSGDTIYILLASDWSDSMTLADVQKAAYNVGGDAYTAAGTTRARITDTSFDNKDGKDITGATFNALFVEVNSDGKYFSWTDTLTSTASNDSSKNVLSYTGTQIAGKLTAFGGEYKSFGVPEPTSGLLLLLGMGALALRRKRA